MARIVQGQPFARIAQRTRARLLVMRPAVASFGKRGFWARDPTARVRLEGIGRTFIHGFNSALVHDSVHGLLPCLKAVDQESQGFAFEGAAMGLSLLDQLGRANRGRRIAEFLSAAGEDHPYMIHVGVGWTLSRIPMRLESVFAQLDPLLCGLAIDGWGFATGYFRPWSRRAPPPVPRQLTGPRVHCFYQGIGRSWWFVCGADGRLAAARIQSLPEPFRADAWSGIGLASAYAGGVPEQGLREIRALSETYWPDLAQGAAFAAKARQRARNAARHTDIASEIYCKMSSDNAAKVTDVARTEVRPDPAGHAYQDWRKRIVAHFRATLR